MDEDSLLNESELNNYFQDQKFSIEDFKSLDKRKILQSDPVEVADIHSELNEDDLESSDRQRSQHPLKRRD